MNIAHYFTLLRLLIGPLFFLIYTNFELFQIPFSILPYCLLSLLFISELSDAADGYLARKLNQVTDLGKILDPMADSICRISIFLAFTSPPINLSVGYIFIFLYRDFLISCLRTICALKGIALSARLSGKFKAIFQGITSLCITFLLIPFSQGHIREEELHLISTWITGIVAIYTFFSGIEYLIANREHIRQAFRFKSPLIQKQDS